MNLLITKGSTITRVLGVLAIISFYFPQAAVANENALACIRFLERFSAPLRELHALKFPRSKAAERSAIVGRLVNDKQVRRLFSPEPMKLLSTLLNEVSEESLAGLVDKLGQQKGGIISLTPESQIKSHMGVSDRGSPFLSLLPNPTVEEFVHERSHLDDLFKESAKEKKRRRLSDRDANIEAVVRMGTPMGVCITEAGACLTQIEQNIVRLQLRLDPLNYEVAPTRFLEDLSVGDYTAEINLKRMVLYPYLKALIRSLRIEADPFSKKRAAYARTQRPLREELVTKMISAFQSTHASFREFCHLLAKSKWAKESGNQARLRSEELRIKNTDSNRQLRSILLELLTDYSDNESSKTLMAVFDNQK